MIKEFIIVAILLAIFDYVWLKFIFVDIWSKMINNIQLSPMLLDNRFIIPAYILMTLSIVIYVIPKINKEHILRDSIIYGGLMGLIIYGIFDMTNLVVFKKYSTNIAFIDITWGTFLFTITTLITKKLIIYLEDII
jgi:uncharacterized membrane protein